MKDVYILSIESSCDETSMSIIKNGIEEIHEVSMSKEENDSFMNSVNKLKQLINDKLY